MATTGVPFATCRFQSRAAVDDANVDEEASTLGRPPRLGDGPLLGFDVHLSSLVEEPPPEFQLPRLAGRYRRPGRRYAFPIAGSALDAPLAEVVVLVDDATSKDPFAVERRRSFSVVFVGQASPDERCRPRSHRRDEPSAIHPPRYVRFGKTVTDSSR